MTSMNGAHIDDILKKEEEYRRLNEELEAKTAKLVEEADFVLRSPSSSFSKPSLLSKIDSDDFLEWNDDEESELRKSKAVTKPKNQLNKSILKPKLAWDKKPSQRQSVEVFQNEPTASNNCESEIRFYKAKIRVLQEEINRSGEKLMKKTDKTTELTNKLKSVEDELLKNQKTINSQGGTVLKLNKLVDDAKSKVSRISTEVDGLRNKIQNLKKIEKKVNNNQGDLDGQLQKAIDDAKKYKEELQILRSQKKEESQMGRKDLKDLLSENQSLEKSKKELLLAFNKNNKLIELLKKQKSLLEEAKNIDFTEAEFSRLIDWKEK